MVRALSKMVRNVSRGMRTINKVGRMFVRGQGFGQLPLAWWKPDNVHYREWKNDFSAYRRLGVDLLRSMEELLKAVNTQRLGERVAKIGTIMHDQNVGGRLGRLSVIVEQHLDWVTRQRQEERDAHKALHAAILLLVEKVEGVERQGMIIANRLSGLVGVLEDEFEDDDVCPEETEGDAALHNNYVDGEDRFVQDREDGKSNDEHEERHGAVGNDDGAVGNDDGAVGNDDGRGEDS